MARIRVEKHVCDICGGEGYQRDCILCGRECCLLCHKSSCFNIDVCKQCAQRDDYKDVFNAFLEKFRRFAKLEQKALSQLPQFKPKICKKCERAVRKLVTFRLHNKIHKTCVLCRDTIKKEGYY